jgi:general secretion pathway protein L
MITAALIHYLCPACRAPAEWAEALAAAATAWPADRGPVDTLAFEPGRLILSAQGWSPEQIEALRSQLRSEGWTLEASEGRLVISHERRS